MARPHGYHAVTPYLIVHDATRALEFYKAAFGATERMRMPMPDGKIGHAEITIGDSILMLADEFPQEGYVSPQALKGTTVSLMIYTDNVDAAFAKAIAAGGTEVRPVADQFYGDRTGTLKDPFGHVWTIATHVREVSMAEMEQHLAKMGQG